MEGNVRWKLISHVTWLEYLDLGAPGPDCSPDQGRVENSSRISAILIRSKLRLRIAIVLLKSAPGPRLLSRISIDVVCSFFSLFFCNGRRIPGNGNYTERRASYRGKRLTPEYLSWNLWSEWIQTYLPIWKRSLPSTIPWYVIRWNRLLDIKVSEHAFDV